MSGLSRPATAGLAGLGLIAVGAVAVLAIQNPRPPEVPGHIPAGWTPTPVPATPFPSAEPSFDPGLPVTLTEVAAGRPVRIEGAGPRQIAWHVPDGSMIVAALDCSRCTGQVRLVAGDREQPVVSAAAPSSPAALLNAGPARDGLIRVEAAGKWRVSLTSAGDLPTVREAAGTGPGVVALGPGSAVDLATAAATGLVRVYGPNREQIAERHLEAGAGRLPASLPAVVSVEIDGPWRIRVVG